MTFFETHQNDTNDEWFQAIKQEGIEDYNDSLYFDLDGQQEQQFKDNIAALESENTLTTAQLQQWEKQQFIFIGTSSESDYLVCDDNATYVIPYDLHTSDIESFPMTIGTFMEQWTTHQLQSRFLIA